MYFTVNSRPVPSTCPRICVSTKKSGNSGSKSSHSSSAFFPSPSFLWNQQIFPLQVSSTVMTHMMIICNAIYASCILAYRVFAANCAFVAIFLVVFRNKTLAFTRYYMLCLENWTNSHGLNSRQLAFGNIDRNPVFIRIPPFLLQKPRALRKNI